MPPVKRKRFRNSVWASLCVHVSPEFVRASAFVPFPVQRRSCPTSGFPPFVDFFNIPRWRCGVTIFWKLFDGRYESPESSFAFCGTPAVERKNPVESIVRDRRLSTGPMIDYPPRLVYCRRNRSQLKRTYLARQPSPRLRLHVAEARAHARAS